MLLPYWSPYINRSSSHLLGWFSTLKMDVICLSESLFTYGLHGSISQKITTFIITAVIISNATLRFLSVSEVRKFRTWNWSLPASHGSLQSFQMLEWYLMYSTACSQPTQTYNHFYVFLHICVSLNHHSGTHVKGGRPSPVLGSVGLVTYTFSFFRKSLLFRLPVPSTAL
jgi:hypothetical protein